MYCNAHMMLFPVLYVAAWSWPVAVHLSCLSMDIHGSIMTNIGLWSIMIVSVVQQNSPDDSTAVQLSSKLPFIMVQW